MLTGKRAFQRSTSAETMTAILNEDPPGISQIAPTTPPGLQRVVHRCLEKNPEQRFQSASDLAFALEALSESGSVPAVAVSEASGQRQRSKVLVWSGGVVAILTLVAAAYLVIASRNSVPALRVSEYTKITHDGHAKVLKGTDGIRLYFDPDQPNPSTRLPFQAERSCRSRLRCLLFRGWWTFPRTDPLFSSRPSQEA